MGLQPGYRSTGGPEGQSSSAASALEVARLMMPPVKGPIIVMISLALSASAPAGERAFVFSVIPERTTENRAFVFTVYVHE